jgi:hypothetical protein
MEGFSNRQTVFAFLFQKFLDFLLKGRSGAWCARGMGLEWLCRMLTQMMRALARA